MKERLNPIGRYKKFRGFDDSRARGRPLSSLPADGTVEQQIQNDQITAYEQLDLQHHYFATQIRAIRLEIAALERSRDALIVKPRESSNTGPWELREQVRKAQRNLVAAKIKWGLGTSRRIGPKRKILQFDENCKLTVTKAPEALTAEELVAKNQEILQEWRRAIKKRFWDVIRTKIVSNYWTIYYIPSIAERRIKLGELLRKAHSTRRSQAALCSITPQAAYLLACSEFYALRQQEEMDVRMGIIQARTFERKMGVTVNEKEVWREGRVLVKWEREANRLKKLTLDPKVKRKNGEPTTLEGGAKIGDGGLQDVLVDKKQTVVY
jgi:hypothetical protein